MKPINIYLIAYNAASAAGWAYVLYLALNALRDEKSAADAWSSFGDALVIVQSTMSFEILHAMLGFVRSPVFVTTLQVSSRLWVVWGATVYSKEAQEHWSLYLMVISWCLAEIPRYLFYMFNLALGDVPFPVFWWRYSAFMILYPTGITGEIFQIWKSLTYWGDFWWARMLQVILVLYAPGSPFMIGNMQRNRKSAFKKRRNAANPVASLSGLVWPVTNQTTNERSTSKTNQAIWVAAVGAVDKAAEAKAHKEKNWRFGYVKHVEANVRASLRSPKAALKVAEEGLNTAHEKFEFVRGGNKTSLKEAMNSYTDAAFETFVIKPSKTLKSKGELKVSYNGQVGKRYNQSNNTYRREISGKDLSAQLDIWVNYGVIEESCRDAIQACIDNPEWFDLSDYTFVLLGAGSAMGPLPLLLSLGANIIAVDIDRPRGWQYMIDLANKSTGTFTFPIKRSKLKAEKPDETWSAEQLAGVAGADLLKDTPEIATWLCSVCPDKKVTIGNYTYLDGALHVQLSLACDAIISKVAQKRKDLAIAFLCTPTDVHCVPKAAHEAAKANLITAPWWQKYSPFSLVPNAIDPVATDDGHTIYIVDGVVADQGPSYILAKRLQHWRAILMWSKGHTISSNVAPSTATISVTSNAQFAAAYCGLHLFKPMEVMYPETSNSVMGALLIHDIRNTKAPAAPGKNKSIQNPLQIFEYGSFHGGAYRCGFKFGSTGILAAMAFYMGQPGVLAGLFAFISVVAWVALGHEKMLLMMQI